MPKGPKGQKRPGDVVGAAVKVARIATGEVEETTKDTKSKAAQQLGRLGGNARARKISPQRRKEIAIKAATTRWRKQMEWHKTLTNSDAQQKGQGALMPFLRFTKEKGEYDHTTWFRDTFFADAEWKPATSKQGRAIEEARIGIYVKILKEDMGLRHMRLDHDPARAKNHNAPTTHLHYDTKTRTKLESTGLTGRHVVVRAHAGEYSLEIV